MDATWMELLKQIGFYGTAAFLVWRFATKFVNKFFDAQEKQLARCHEEFARQSETFAKAIDKRDTQVDEITKCLQEQTSTLKTISEQTGKIAIKLTV